MKPSLNLSKILIDGSGGGPAFSIGSGSVETNIMFDATFFFLSLVLFSISLFLLRQSVALERAIDIKKENKKQNHLYIIGEIFGWTFSFIIIILWVFYVYFHSAYLRGFMIPFNEWLFEMIIFRLNIFVPPLLVGAIIPVLVAIYHFATIHTVLSNLTPEKNEFKQRGLLGLTFSFIGFLANLITLITFLMLFSYSS